MDRELSKQNDISLAPEKNEPYIRDSGELFHQSGLSHQIKNFELHWQNKKE